MKKYWSTEVSIPTFLVKFWNREKFAKVIKKLGRNFGIEKNFAKVIKKLGRNFSKM